MVTSGQAVRRAKYMEIKLLCTAMFDGTVVKLGLGVGGVAPGPVLVSIRVAAVVLCQVAVRVGARVDPAQQSPES